ncbi:PAS domain S-box protein [Lentimicrobium sp.]|uniref:PAS domain S-box protein n=1 Tax=Lentimicrobium sp. TaxID=2034841 RepID=UPI002BC62B85|nr:PAS domain S-box protein [Lentimicrobium sp.]HPJ62617.1 PAS domain S-box protein [Lentimicrobium sp.]
MNSEREITGDKNSSNKMLNPDMGALENDYKKEQNQRKKAENLLRLSEIKIQALTEAIPDLIFRINREGVYLDYKAASSDLFHQADSIIGKNNREITPPDFADLIDAKIKLTLDTGEMQYFEYQLPIPLKGLCSYEARLVPNGPDEVLAIVRDVTGNRLTGEALIESNLNQRAIMDSISDGLLLINKDGTIIDSNQANAKFYGFSTESIRGKNLFDFFPSSYKPNREELLKVVFEKGKALESESFFHDRWFEYAVHPVADASGIINKAVINARDVTHQKNLISDLETALKENRESSEFLENLINSIPDVIGIQDNKHQIIRYNKAGYEFLNTSPEQIRGKKCFHLIDRDQECELCATSISYRTKKPAHIERYFPEKQLWLDIRSYPILDNKGEIRLVIEHLRDITHIKAIEVALRKSEERYKELFNSSAGGILIGSQEGVIIQVNSTFAEMTGFAPEFLIGKHISESIFTEESLKAFPFRFDLLKQGKTVTSERTIITADNRLLQVEMHTHILPDGTYQSIYHDITERKRAEEEINRQNEALRKINLEKDKFFSIIAHDLRSPFTSFLGLTELMAEEIDSMPREEVRFIANELKKSASNLYNLLENLLEWSMVQRNMKPFSPQKINLRSVARQSTETLREAATSKKIRVTLDIPEEITVRADKPMLDTIFRNLFSNAVKFTAKGGSVTISAGETLNGNIEIKINDSGIGIPETMIGTIFNISGKHNRPGTSGEPSTGLGLLLCKEFIEKNGGKINVKSTVGKGSCFYFTLPGG